MVSESGKQSQPDGATIAPMLTQQELQRRVRAARVLTDTTQADMNAAGHTRGLGKHELGAAERGDIDIRQYHLPMLCEILQVPMSWFTEPHETIVAPRAADYVRVLNQLLDIIETQAEGGEPGRRLRFPRGRQPDRQAPGGKTRRAN